MFKKHLDDLFDCLRDVLWIIYIHFVKFIIFVDLGLLRYVAEKDVGGINS